MELGFAGGGEVPSQPGSIRLCESNLCSIHCNTSFKLFVDRPCKSVFQCKITFCGFKNSCGCSTRFHSRRVFKRFRLQQTPDSRTCQSATKLHHFFRFAVLAVAGSAYLGSTQVSKGSCYWARLYSCVSAVFRRGDACILCLHCNLQPCCCKISIPAGFWSALLRHFVNRDNHLCWQIMQLFLRWPHGSIRG